MNRFLVLVLLLNLATNVFADAIKVTITNNKTGKILNETIISSERVKATEYYIIDFPDWIITAAENKADLRVDAFILELSDKNVNKINETEKLDIVANTIVESRIERDFEEKQKLNITR